MNKEMQELVDNRFDMKKEAIIECEEILEIAREISTLIEKTKDKLEEFSKVILKNTKIYIEKNKNNDEIGLIRVPINTFINREIESLLDKKNGVYDEVENQIIKQYRNSGYPVVKRGGEFKNRISRCASRTINYRFVVRNVELQGLNSQQKIGKGTDYIGRESTGINTDKLIISMDNGLEKRIGDEIIKNFK